MVRLIIRTILISIHAAISFLTGLLLCLLRPFSLKNIKDTARFFSYGSLKILGIDFKVQGREFLHHGPCIFISNHQNNLDLVVGAAIFPPKTVTLGKKSLAWIPIFGQFYWLSGNILIDRQNKRKAKASMEKVTSEIQEKGKSIWILPEGTRSRGRGLLPFKKGAFLAAINAQVPIVPICFSSYHNKLDWSSRCPGSVLVKILPPVSTKGLHPQDAHHLADQCWQIMRDVIDGLDRQIEKNL